MTSLKPIAAQAFHQLHQGGLLPIANIWDAGTARLVESLGAKALATTSAGVAWSHGYPDGDLLPTDRLVATVESIARVVAVPLSVDIEGGYSDDPSAVAGLVGRLIDAGAVGINIEDGAGSPEVLCAKIERIKKTGAALGVDVFVNARTDVYLRGLSSAENRLAETLARAERYDGAGADGIFVPALIDADEIRQIASGTRLPLNVLAYPGLPAAAELENLGVRRLSAGSGITQAAYGRIAMLARDFLARGESPPLGQGAMMYPEINGLMNAG